jgi:hypothetical protein
MAVNSLRPQMGTTERGSNLYCRQIFPMKRVKTDACRLCRKRNVFEHLHAMPERKYSPKDQHNLNWLCYHLPTRGSSNPSLFRVGNLR